MGDAELRRSPLSIEQRVKDNILHVPERLRLHHRVSAQSPNLSQAGSEWELVQALRSWVYSNVCEQEGIEATLDQRTDFLFAEADAPAIFSAFDARVAGVWCGGIGQALRKLYQMYGFDAFVLDCGLPSTGSTHISNVVKICDGNRPLWTVQDAYYDLSYSRTDGSPLDAIDMVRMLRKMNDHEVRVCNGLRAARTLICSPDETTIQNSWRIEHPNPLDQLEQLLPDGRYVFRTRPSIDALISHGRADNLFDVLRAHGYPENLVYMYCLVFGVYPSDASGASSLLTALHSHLDSVFVH
jgi:hypothetical protein